MKTIPKMQSSGAVLAAVLLMMGCSDKPDADTQASAQIADQAVSQNEQTAQVAQTAQPQANQADSSAVLPPEQMLAATQADTQQLPFIGKRSFNFAGGNCTEHEIKITADAQVTLTVHGCESSGIYYQGKFTNPIKLHSDYYNEPYYLQIVDDKIYELDANMQISRSCSVLGRDDELCIDNLY